MKSEEFLNALGGQLIELMKSEKENLLKAIDQGEWMKADLSLKRTFLIRSQIFLLNKILEKSNV